MNKKGNGRVTNSKRKRGYMMDTTRNVVVRNASGMMCIMHVIMLVNVFQLPMDIQTGENIMLFKSLNTNKIMFTGQHMPYRMGNVDVMVHPIVIFDAFICPNMYHYVLQKSRGVCITASVRQHLLSGLMEPCDYTGDEAGHHKTTQVRLGETHRPQVQGPDHSVRRRNQTIIKCQQDRVCTMRYIVEYCYICLCKMKLCINSGRTSRIGWTSKYMYVNQNQANAVIPLYYQNMDAYQYFTGDNMYCHIKPNVEIPLFYQKQYTQLFYNRNGKFYVPMIFSLSGIRWYKHKTRVYENAHDCNICCSNMKCYLSLQKYSPGQQRTTYSTNLEQPSAVTHTPHGKYGNQSQAKATQTGMKAHRASQWTQTATSLDDGPLYETMKPSQILRLVCVKSNWCKGCRNENADWYIYNNNTV